MSDIGPAACIAPRVVAAAADGVIDLIQVLGADPDRVLGNVGVRLTDLQEPMHELTLVNYCALFETAASFTGCDNFGLRFGQAFKPRQLGALGYLAMSSPTLFTALRNMADYMPAHQQATTFGLTVYGDLAQMEYQIRDGRIPHRRQDAELSLGVLCNLIRHCVGRFWRPLEVHFEHPRPSDAQEHEQMFQAPVYFGRSTNAVVFRRIDLDGLVNTADPYLLGVLEPMLRERATRSQTDDVVGLARRAIEHGLRGGGPAIGPVAAQLGMTSRTFHRRLRQHGLTFSDLVRAVRRDLAREYLAAPHIPLTEIAFLLGYSELSAFSRAFQNWTGLPPNRYRRRCLAAAHPPSSSSAPSDSGSTCPPSMISVWPVM